jgi:hypothetical protein
MTESHTINNIILANWINLFMSNKFLTFIFFYFELISLCVIWNHLCKSKISDLFLLNIQNFGNSNRFEKQFN